MLHSSISVSCERGRVRVSLVICMREKFSVYTLLSHQCRSSTMNRHEQLIRRYLLSIFLPSSKELNANCPLQHDNFINMRHINHFIFFAFPFESRHVSNWELKTVLNECLIHIYICIYILAYSQKAHVVKVVHAGSVTHTALLSNTVRQSSHATQRQSSYRSTAGNGKMEGTRTSTRTAPLCYTRLDS